MTRVVPPRLSVPDLRGVKIALERWASTVTTQLNGVSESRIDAKHNALTAAPTTGSYQHGDFIPNSTPTEAGAALSKYVVIGWICTAEGSPGTWVECRCLTGN